MENTPKLIVFDKEFDKGCCAGVDLQIYNLLFGRIPFEVNGEELFLPPAPVEGGTGPLHYKRSFGTEVTRDWNFIHYGAPGYSREIEMVEVFLRLPEPKGNPQRKLAFAAFEDMPVLLMYEKDAQRTVAMMEKYFNPGVAVAHLDQFHTTVTDEDMAEYEEKQRQLDAKGDTFLRSLRRLADPPREHYQAIIFDAFPEQRYYDSPEEGESVFLEYFENKRHVSTEDVLPDQESFD